MLHLLDRFKLDDQTDKPHHVPCAVHPLESQSGLVQGKKARMLAEAETSTKSLSAVYGLRRR